MSLKPIGKVSNFADEKTMQLLALWKESVSIVELDKTDAQELLYEEYSHYIVVHDSLKMEFPEKRKEWNRRFCRDAGVSVVELIKVHENKIYFKGLFAANNSSVYGILPYTTFDSQEADFPSAEMEILKKQTMEVALPQAKGKTILDVGCGIGSVTLQMARMNPESKVTGIDLLEKTMEQCRLSAIGYDIKNTFFKSASAYELPFANGEFEIVTCFFMLHHLDDIPKALSEVKRVIAREGKVLAVEPLDHHHGIERGIQDWVDHFENAGFAVETEQINRAIFVSARLK
ncbi:methyltransferase domain-containing protein [Methanolobus sp. ZRKC5]|uniref:class I SAM-dependent methyltransferase n=1 Tax=unclassified Methanolobus TaxID=2629569 RepID=UPI00313BE0CE